MNRLHFFGLFVAVVLFSLTGCGGGGSTRASVPPPDPPSAPTLTRLSPTFGLTGISGDFKHLTIYGTGFANGAVVHFGAVNLTPVSTTATTITATIPVAEFAAPKTVQVTVTNPGAVSSSPLAFSITDAGFVSLTFDDGYSSAYNNGVPILDAAGLKCTFYVVAHFVGNTDDGYVTVEQLQTMAKNGHEIGNHTQTHPYLSTVSPEQLVAETSGAEQDLKNWGFDAATFSYPYDDFGTGEGGAVVNAVIAAGVRGARDSDYAGYNNATSYPFLLDAMPSESDLGTDNVDTVTGWIQTAVTNKMWVIILWHHVDEAGNPYNVPSPVIQDVVDYIKANGVHVATDSEGLVIENMNPPQQ